MPTEPRLEDQRLKWQQEVASTIQSQVQQLSQQVLAIYQQPSGNAESRQAKALESIQQASREFAKLCVNRGPKWLKDQNLWSGRTVSGWVDTDLTAAMQHLPAPPLTPPQSVLELPLRSWMLASGVGAFVGMLAGAPLSWLMLGQREAGLAAGGILGAIGLVALIGSLSQSPTIRSHLANVLAASAGVSLLVGLWNFYRNGTKGLLGTALGLGATALLIFFTKPHTRLLLDAQQLQATLEHHFRTVADLMLAWCWAHPDRTPSAPIGTTSKKGLPNSVLDALAELYTDLQLKRSPDEIREMVDVLFEKFLQEGYVWKTVPTGTHFQESFLEFYEVLGRPGASDKFRTRRAALLIAGQVERRGELRRMD